MKKLRLVIIVTILTIAVQQLVFLYIENEYLTSNNIVIEKIENTEKPKENKEEINLSLNASDIQISSDGRYVAYRSDEKIEVLDSTGYSKKQVSAENLNHIEFYKWLNNDNNMILINKIKDGDKEYFEPIAYNAKNEEERKILDFDFNKIKIEANQGDKVDDVSFSTLTHSIYIKIKKENNSCDLYYANVMNQLEKVKENEDIRSVVVPPSNTNAVMKIGKEIKILNKSESVQIPNVNELEILGTDINNNVYFGESENGLIKNIYFTDLSGPNYNWNNYNLEKEIPKGDIIIDYLGKIYINIKDESYVLELISNKKLNYKGTILQSYSEGIISRKDDKLIKYKLSNN